MCRTRIIKCAIYKNKNAIRRIWKTNIPYRLYQQNTMTAVYAENKENKKYTKQTNKHTKTRKYAKYTMNANKQKQRFSKNKI